jgi:hypothetical protein
MPRKAMPQKAKKWYAIFHYKIETTLSTLQMLTMTHFDGLIRTTIVSYTDKRFPAGKQLTTGVYVMMDIAPFGYIFNRYKIVERHANHVMLSRLKNGKWGEPFRRDISIINGVEAIYGVCVWKWIKPFHKLDTLFTKQEWKTLSLEDKCQRYNEA